MRKAWRLDVAMSVALSILYTSASTQIPVRPIGLGYTADMGVDACA
jgi:hypothetical protein